jgi:hypothetical protein
MSRPQVVPACVNRLIADPAAGPATTEVEVDNHK